MSTEFSIAMRYLFSRERRALVSVITLIATMGVAIGVAALIATLAVMDGARDLLFGRMTQLYPHVSIQLINPDRNVAPDMQLVKRLNADPRVEAAVPVLSKPGVIQPARGLESEKSPVYVFGLDEGVAKLYPATHLSGDDLTTNSVVLGAALARNLNVKKGDTVQLLTVDPHAPAAAQQVKMARLTVATTITMGFNEFDASTIFMNKKRMSQLYGGVKFEYIHVKLKDPMAAAEFEQPLKSQLPAGYGSWNWSDPDHSGGFFQMLTIQKYLLFALLLLIVVVAAFNIIGTLILMVNEKTREIGILRAIGAGEGMVSRVFLYDGMLVGLLGTAIGVGLGLVICALIPSISPHMPAAIYNFETLPVKIHWGSVALVVASSLIISTLAALLPARHAAKLKPVEALRYD